ncbi:MAG: hypothetical protein OER80_00940 [Gammaproteobacteria bacterium]|nr:hypothetical protein [Gammaproteobacteria bacterium]MDH3768044.1 hypothetical protein [Gammaproteobacteria bacterium]
MPQLLAVLAVVWLNMALNPCAMALGETEEHDCPHCPPVHHCDEQVNKRCTYVDTVDSDGRNHNGHVPDFSDPAYVLIVVPIAPDMSFALSLRPDVLHATGPPAPPLYQTHCTYLI